MSTVMAAQITPSSDGPVNGAPATGLDIMLNYSQLELMLLTVKAIQSRLL